MKADKQEVIYLDYLATTPCDPRVIEAMLPYFTASFGNAGSVHQLGRAAEEAVEEARQEMAQLLQVSPHEVIWTSGATESNNLAIKGAVRFLKTQGDTRRRVITAATEHKCVLEAVRSLADEGFEPIILPVGPDGRVEPNRLAEALKTPTALVSLMAANNETGIIHDIPQLMPLIKQAGTLLHVDMAQRFGKLPCSLEGIDLASFSAHKLYGPKGVGALYIRRRPRVRLLPLISGGGQERGMRSGTLPVPLIVGMAVAARLALAAQPEEVPRLMALRGQLWQAMQRLCPTARLNGGQAPHLPGVLNCCLPDGPEAQDLMKSLPGLAFSAGSACSAASGAPSYVLQAMGLTDREARRSLRLSVGRFTSADDVERAVAQFRQVLTGG
ncbi:cysteine desulfurase family protein [Bombella pollinis]|uniref:Cysteine desulfurase n=1 Tax=Bombella pollinis TaxID=2967337 RepID=A0ABT3WU39_9PROT|nr:cysteine desulfurase family protein [Bombella pollinis]MCX5620396.1 cysteine desulfurase [Bombella pollinis]